MRTYKSLVQLTLYQFRSMMRNRMALFFNLLIPVLMLVIFGTSFGPSSGGPVAKVGYVSLDQGSQAQDFKAFLDKNVLYRFINGAEADMRQRLSRGDVQAVLVVPSDFSAQVSGRMVPGSVTILYDASSTSSGTTLSGLYQLVGMYDSQVRGGSPVVVPKPESLADVGRSSIFDFLMPGQLVFMLCSAGLITVAASVATTRGTGAMRHLFSTPLTTGVWLAARIMANLVLAALQLVILYGAGMLLYGIHLPLNIPGTLALLVLAALMTLSLGLAIGMLAKTWESALAISLIIYMVLALLGDVSFPLANSPQMIQSLSRFVPSTYMTHSLRLVMMHGKSLLAVGTDLAVMASLTAICLGVGAWGLRRQFTEPR